MPLTLLGAVLGAVGIFLLVHSLGKSRNAGDPLAARLSVYDVALDEEEIALQRPFAERILMPLTSQLRTFLGNQTPTRTRAALTSRIALAGRPNNIDADTFVAIRYGMAIMFFLIGLVLGLLARSPVFIAVGASAGALIGYFGPVMWLKQKVDGRRKVIRLALPDSMDLLTIAVEAGLGFDAALVRLTEKMKNALGDEFATVLAEVRLGRPRMEALDDLGRRCGVDDLHNFVQAVIQSEMMGVGLAKILRLQSDEMRRKRRQYAQEKAAQATLKMLLPMVGCIFPTLWIVLLGPAILIIMARQNGH